MKTPATLWFMSYIVNVIRFFSKRESDNAVYAVFCGTECDFLLLE